MLSRALLLPLLLLVPAFAAVAACSSDVKPDAGPSDSSVADAECVEDQIGDPCPIGCSLGSHFFCYQGRWSCTQSDCIPVDAAREVDAADAGIDAAADAPKDG